MEYRNSHRVPTALEMAVHMHCRLLETMPSVIYRMYRVDTIHCSIVHCSQTILKHIAESAIFNRRQCPSILTAVSTGSSKILEIYNSPWMIHFYSKFYVCIVSIDYYVKCVTFSCGNHKMGLESIQNG